MKTSRKPLFAVAAFTLTAALSFLSCTKDATPAPTGHTVKYEITGDFTGKLMIVYNDNVSGNTTVNNAALPWTKEITYGSNVLAIGVGGNSSAFGTPGQTATLKLYVDGNLKKTETKTAGNSGELSLPTFAYSF